MPSSETDSSTLNEDNSNTTTNKIVNKDATNTSGFDHNEDTDAQASLLRLTRRHSLPASYHLSNFLSFFSQNGVNSTHESSNVNEAHNSSGTPPQVNANTTRHTRSATASGLVGQTTPRSSVNRYRYGHRHTRSVVDQPVVVRTYNPPATLRVPARAGMMNPAIFEEEETQRIELPPIEAFSFDGILKAINPEVSKTLDKISYLCVRLKEDVKAEIEVAAQTQKEIHGQKKLVERLAAQALKTTNTRSETLASDSHGLKGGAAIEDLAQLTERTYTALGSIVSTLLAIDELLPLQERLAPGYSAHQTHYPRVHELLNKKHQEITARFGGGAIALGRGSEGARMISKTPRHSTTSPTLSPPGSPNLLSASLPNPTHQEPGWLRRRMSSSSAMLLSPNSPTSNLGASTAAKRLSLPPHLQLKTILPSPSYGQSPPHPASYGSRRDSTPGLTSNPSNMASRRRSTNNLLLPRDSGERRYNTRPSSELSDSERNTGRSSSSFSGGIFDTGSWKGTGKWNIFGNGGAGSNESERGMSAEEKLRQMLNGANGKGKAIDRRA
ncbi:hypothetical protein L211DRAFT_865926 [Terfezia boudieri ATCC MYA-4762]|uniref:FANCI solenoid 4 domain-containing protein n=1 Tax=Terfezia boudieri ATCC MYA-4762 TaxID=1051890 RepID=A0A3N4LZK0_9PEZI|nr:hypothetical protein L211DRAFT_865926 [Terfezia boudieri ATCC MYA-4762]